MLGLFTPHTSLPSPLSALPARLPARPSATSFVRHCFTFAFLTTVAFPTSTRWCLSAWA